MANCICHIFGYEIKDAAARRAIDALEKRVAALEGGVTPDEPDTPDEPEKPVIESFDVIGPMMAVPFDFEHGMTWSEWLVSEYNTYRFTVEGNTILLDGDVLYMPDRVTMVSPLDVITAGTTYRLITPTGDTYTVSYYKRNEFCKDGQSDYTMPEFVTAQTYAEGDTITPPALPNEEGFTASDWE